MLTSSTSFRFFTQVVLVERIEFVESSGLKVRIGVSLHDRCDLKIIKFSFNQTNFLVKKKNLLKCLLELILASLV